MENPNVYVGDISKLKKAAVLKIRFTKGALIFITISSLAYIVGLALLVMELFDFSFKVYE